MQCSNHMKGWFAGNTKAEKNLAIRLHNAQRELTTVMKSARLSRSLEECWLLFYSHSACNGTGKGDRAPDRNLSAPDKWQMQEKSFQFTLTLEFSEFFRRLHSSLISPCNFIKRNRKAYPLTLIFEVFWTVRIH